VGAQIPVITSLTSSTFDYKRFSIDALGDHVNTCTVHPGTKKVHDWTVENLTDLFSHTPQRKDTTGDRGQRCGDIELNNRPSTSLIHVSSSTVILCEFYW
jgi:hypothetical protein